MKTTAVSARGGVVLLAVVLAGCMGTSSLRKGGGAKKLEKDYAVSYEVLYKAVTDSMDDLGIAIQNDDPAKGEILGMGAKTPVCMGKVVGAYLTRVGPEQTKLEIQERYVYGGNAVLSTCQDQASQLDLKLKRRLRDLGSVAAASPAPRAAAAPAVIESDVDRLPGSAAKPRKAYALVFGIENYREKLPKAEFAGRDGRLVSEYLTKVMGFPEANVVTRIDENASLTDMAKYIESWLPNNVESGDSVFVYYSGHGAPNPKTGEAFLVPYDGDPSFTETTTYPLSRLYASLDKLPARDVIVVLDSCFSGAGGRSVMAKGARPLLTTVANPVSAVGRTVVLSASAGDQISSAYAEQGHGLLTYFFLKGLKGDADGDKNGKIDMTELFEYVKPNVQRVARKQYNHEQTPQLQGNPDRVAKGGGRLLE